MLADSKNGDIIESKMPELTPALIRKLKKIGRDIKKAQDKLPPCAFRYEY